MNSALRLASCVVLLCGVAMAQAQPVDDEKEEMPGSTAQYEAGFHMGKLLPNQIPGVTEILSLGGLRGGYRISPSSFLESGIIFGNSKGVQWKNYHADIRLDQPIEGVLAMAYLGVDMFYYTGINQSSKLLFGGHAGGGVKAHISGGTWFRVDMKFGFSPGTSLFIGAGFEYRFGESSASSAAAGG